MLEIGSIFEGIYRVQAELGHGGQSHVYLIRNERANKLWAVKEIVKTTGSAKDAIKQNLIAEAEILKGLRHPNLPTIVDVIDKPDVYYIIMDYVEGVTLQDVLSDEGKQPQGKVVKWALQVCDVFRYLHSQDPKIIYRDCKPKNLMLRPDGNIVVIDFGAAREYKPHKTDDTQAIGTLGYAAPEQFAEVIGQTDERTDIYNLGATMYHLVTGHNPSQFPYDMYPIRHWDKSLSSGLEQIILKCTKKNPQERYQTAEELSYALAHYTELEDEYKKKQRLKKTVLGIVAGLALTSFTGAFVLRGEARRELNAEYETVVRNAETATSKEKQIELYREAVSLRPSDETAYMELLNRVCLEDSVFEKEEADTMTEILGARTGRTVHEAAFMENRPGYDEFSYNLGLAYFYYYEGEGNKPMSEPWLKTASESETLDAAKVERAKRLSNIAGYYNKLNRANKAGDTEVSYRDYWDDMDALSAGNVVEADNAKTAYVVYQEMSYQIRMHAHEFIKSGVSAEDMLSKIEEIREHMETDFSGSDKEQNEDVIRVIDENLRRAEEAVRLNGKGGATDGT